MEKNSELAWQVYDLIEKNLDKLNMYSWVTAEAWADLEHWAGAPVVTLDDLTGDVCGTTACVAGWTALVKGWVITGSATAINVATGQERWSIPALAAELLDIELHDEYGAGYGEGYELFYNTRNEELEGRLVAVFGPRPDADQR